MSPSCLLSSLPPSCQYSSWQESFLCSYVNEAPIHVYWRTCVCLILVTTGLKLTNVAKISVCSTDPSMTLTSVRPEKHVIAVPATSKAQGHLCKNFQHPQQSTRIHLLLRQNLHLPLCTLGSRKQRPKHTPDFRPMATATYSRPSDPPFTAVQLAVRDWEIRKGGISIR